MPATSDLDSAPQPKSGAEKATRSPRLRRDGLIPIADGYLLRNVVEASTRGLSWFAGLFLAFAIVTSARRVAQDSLPLSLVLELIWLQMPRIILFTIPASILFGTVSTFTEMSSRGEITALMAGSMSLWRMLRGPLAYAALMGIFAFVLQEVIVPNAESRKDSIIKGAAARIGVQENFNFSEKFPNGAFKRVIQAKSFDPVNKSLTSPVVQLHRDDNTIEIEILADRARWDEKRKAWVLEDGETRFNPKARPGKGEQTYAQRTQFREWVLETDLALTPSSLTSTNITTADRLVKQNYEMVSLRDLANYRAKLAKDAAKIQGDEPNEVSERGKAIKRINSTTFGIHDKFATPLICLAMVLIGAPMGIRPQRTASPGLAMGLSLAVMIFYYIVWTLATSWGKAGAPFPQYAAYFTFILIGGVGVVLVSRKS